MNKIGKKEKTKLKKNAEHVGRLVKKSAEFIGHEIKENTELAEHKTGIHDAKNGVTSVANKMKNAI